MIMITEQERKEILSKYSGDTSPELLTYLKRNFPVGENNLSWGEPLKYIVVDGKTRFIKGNKKYLVNKINSLIETEWVGLDEKIRRRTIKKYIDGVSL